jgi:hypothetical protein
MSIYGSGKGGWKDLNDVVQPVAGSSAGGLAAQTAQAEANWNDARKARPAEYLLPITVRWLDAFPLENKPQKLASEYPRICNLIAAQWNDHRGAPKLFQDLLTDRRGGRAGFPAAVKRELMMVQEYWYTGALRL